MIYSFKWAFFWLLIIVALSSFERCRTVQSSAETRAEDLELIADELEKSLPESREKPLILKNLRAGANDLRAAGKRNEALAKAVEKSAKAAGFQSATKWIIAAVAGFILLVGGIIFLLKR
jgi:uncharacterized membrane protein